MKLLTHWLLATSLSAWAAADVTIPANPRTFDGRKTGTSTGGVSVGADKRSGMVRYVTYLGLSETRQWTSTDGKPLMGKLIAFENVVVEAPQGVQPETPEPPKHPTVVRNGKVRLQVEGKTFVVALERLSEADRAFIEEIRNRHAKREEDQASGAD